MRKVRRITTLILLVRKAKRITTIILLILCLAFIVWSRSGRRPPPGAPDLRLLDVSSFGEDTGSGNLLGIQTHMVPADYASEERFRQRLDGYLAAARDKGFIAPKTIVVFPEYLGVWLVAAGEKESVRSAPTLEAASTILVASNLLSFLRWLPFAHAPKRADCAVFKMKARSMAAIYHRVFSGLAAEYRVTIVAGSIFLPDPHVADGVLLPGSGPLYNVSVLYAPDGRAQAPPVRKAFPIEEELGYIAAAEVEDLPTFDTPAGRLGILVCADSWYPEAYAALEAEGVDLIAVPSYILADDRWNSPWFGYDPEQPPPGMSAEDLRHMTERDAWMAYALPARLPESRARAGINVFLRGRFWDLGSDGQSLAVLGTTTHASPHIDGAAILNLWLPPP
jgi:predicted amidohydrolase